MKTSSHGILLLNNAGELLLCHTTGSRYWDIPKGGRAEGESGPQTAVRETLEECGLQLNPGDLRELGRFAYRPDKALLLYAVLLERLDTRLLTCSSQYRDQRGQMRPEMDAFRWTAFAEVPKRCAKNLSMVLTQSVSLPNLLKQLQAAGPPVKFAIAGAPGQRQEPS